ncbi:hypothetical protein [Aurantimonas sp. Leaf443]|uniref:hypothetical protein n=1 Tax=Aurantimonas sp. Leaf443 TaxID=1736378 RepID=UPI0006FEB5A1|nr:hypothetical protein [Aurantimonas sp. Leaf443]KQT83805.1 hypothetical protein ASG48_10385 [Aurantimonas sp. Leaf443]
MKLASLRHGRDGRLVVVSHDLTRATDAFLVAPTLQGALDRWSEAGPRLGDLATALELDTVPSFRFHEHDCAGPLPRSYLRLLVDAETDAREVRPAAADLCLGARDAAEVERGAGSGLPGLAVVTGDVPMDASRAAATEAIRLMMLSSGTAGEGPGRFSPVAVTPDEFDAAFADGRLDLPLLRSLDNHAFEPLGSPPFDIAGLLAAAAAARPLRTGTIVEMRLSASGEGRSLRLEMRDARGRSIFGAIEQGVPATA